MFKIDSSEFNQNLTAVMRDSLQQPVFITEHSKPTHVLLSIQDYHQLLQHQPNLAAMLSSDDNLDTEFEKFDHRR